MRIILMGPMAAYDENGRPVKVGGPKQRAVLALLASYDGRVVPTDAIVDGIWGDDPPATVHTTIQVYVHGLRKALGAEAIRTRPPGYVLEGVQVDLAQAAELRAAAAALPADRAEPLLAEVVALWQGDPLADLRAAPFAERQAVQLAEQRLVDLEAWNDARLATGRHRDLVGSLEGLVAQHPVHEAFWAQLVLALYRSGRQGDALMTYRRAREALAEELGVDPGPALRELEEAVLRQDPKLDLPDVPAAPAPGPAVTPGSSLPAEPNPLVGRGADLAVLGDLLTDPALRLITLVGPGGAGKTRLSVAAARSVLADHEDALFVDLGTATGADGLLSGIGGHVGVPPDAADHDAVAAAVAGRRLLVVLDNLEQVAGAAAAVARLVRDAPEVTFLATSRSPLRIAAERVHPVEPLTDEDAASLFLTRARGVRPGLVLDDDTRAVVSELCRRLDHLPLALEIAAAGVRVLAPAAVLERVRAGTHGLTRGPVDLPERQRTLETTVEWSLDLLSPAARALLSRLTVFEAGFGADAADAVCGPSCEVAVLDGLADLVDSSLLRPVDGAGDLSFALYRSVREHPRLAPDPAAAEELRERHARWYLTHVASLGAAIDGPDHAAALRRLTDSEPDITAAARHLRSTGDVQAALELARGLAPYWIATGRIRDGLDALAALDALLPAAPDTAALAADAAVLQGVLHYHLTEWDEAIAALSAAPRALLDRGTAARADCHLGAALMITGTVEEGRRLAADALETAEALDLYDVRVISIAALAIAAAISGDSAAERARYQERLGLVRQHGDRARTVDTLSTLAEIDLEEGDIPSARRHAQEALALLGDDMPAERRDTLVVLARVAMVAEDRAGAAALLTEAWELSVGLGQALGLAQVLAAAAEWAAPANPTEAARMLGAADQLLARTVLADQGEDLAGGLDERLRGDLGAACYQEERDAGAHLARADVVALARSVLSGSSTGS